MVKMLSPYDHLILKRTVEEAEAATDAELAVVIARASDEYRGVGLAAGLVLGSFTALLLWHFHIVVIFPSLLLIQLGICAVMINVPALRHICLKLASKKLLRHRAAMRAAAEYAHLVHHLAAGIPVVLIYISLTERYVHIYSSREVREKILDSEWSAVVQTLTNAAKTQGVAAATVKAVIHAGKMLKAAFPSTGRKHGKAHVAEI